MKEVQGRLTVIGEAPSDVRGRRVRVRCECGIVKVVLYRSFRMNRTQSCGCLRTEKVQKARTTHGHRTNDEVTPEYAAWRSMLQRCYDVNGDSYSWYGGKGVTVCRRWRDSFELFLADVGERPSEEHVFCLLEKSGNFEPGNAAWTTKHEADRRKRSNTFYEVNGVVRCLVDWAKEYGIPKNTLHYRVVTKGMTMRDALDVGRGRQGRLLPE
jgi:hypothetical protein